MSNTALVERMTLSFKLTMAPSPLPLQARMTARSNTRPMDGADGKFYRAADYIIASQYDPTNVQIIDFQVDDCKQRMLE
jgi:hypothetical protein